MANTLRIYADDEIREQLQNGLNKICIADVMCNNQASGISIVYLVDAQQYYWHCNLRLNYYIKLSEDSIVVKDDDVYEGVDIYEMNETTHTLDKTPMGRVRITNQSLMFRYLTEHFVPNNWCHPLIEEWNNPLLLK